MTDVAAGAGAGVGDGAQDAAALGRTEPAVGPAVPAAADAADAADAALDVVAGPGGVGEAEVELALAARAADVRAVAGRVVARLDAAAGEVAGAEVPAAGGVVLVAAETAGEDPDVDAREVAAAGVVEVADAAGHLDEDAAVGDVAAGDVATGEGSLAPAEEAEALEAAATRTAVEREEAAAVRAVALADAARRCGGGCLRPGVWTSWRFGAANDASVISLSRKLCRAFLGSGMYPRPKSFT